MISRVETRKAPANGTKGGETRVRQGRGLDRVDAAEPCERARPGDENVLSVASIWPGGLIAEVLGARRIEAAASAPASDPHDDGIAHANAFRVRTECRDFARTLVTENERPLDDRQKRALVTPNVQIGSTDSAGAHADFAATGLGMSSIRSSRPGSWNWAACIAGFPDTVSPLRPVDNRFPDRVIILPIFARQHGPAAGAQFSTWAQRRESTHEPIPAQRCEE